VLVEEGARAHRRVDEWGTEFDRNRYGKIAFTRGKGQHSRKPRAAPPTETSTRSAEIGRAFF